MPHAVLWDRRRVRDCGRLVHSDVDCSLHSLSVIPASGNLAEVIQRLYSAAWHAAGHLYAPLDLLTNVVQGSPYRTNEQRYSSATLQHRSNFISPYIEMGFSGENYVAVPVGIFATARLGGQATANPVVSDHNGRSNAVPYIRLMCELNDAPFSRAANPMATVPGDAQQSLARRVASVRKQYRSIRSKLCFVGRC